MDKQKIKIAAVVPCYNRERYIGPYLEMMEEFGVTCVVTLGNKPWASQGGDEVLEKDKTEKILNKYFSDVKVLKGDYSHHRDSLNVGIDALQDYDLIFVNDCDMFITKEDWKKCLRFINDNWNYADVFAINFETMIIEYYYNHYYGKAAKPGGIPPIIAVKPKIRVKSMTKTNGGITLVWDEDGPKYHHMRFCKPSGSGKTKCVKPTVENSNLDDYSPAPKEIIDRIEKWEKIIKTIK